MHGDHELGARLRHSLLQERDRSQPLDARWLQALVGDLCQGDQRNLLPPLRHLVLSPVLLGELSRTPPLAEPRSRFRFREELRGVFTSPLCDRMEAVIDGLLDCPVSDGAIGPPPPPPPPSPGHSVPVPKVPPPRAPLASGPGELKQDPSIPAQLDGFAPPEAAPARPRNLWPVLLAGLLGGCLLPLAGLPLLQLIVRRSGPPHGPIGVVATGEPRDAAPGRSEQTSGSGSGAIDAGAESAAARPNPPLVTPPMAAPEPSGLPSAEPSPTDLNGDMGTAATPVAPQLPEAPASEGSAQGADATIPAAVRTLETLYEALSRHDAIAARELFAGEAGDQFDPAFFRQFARVQVNELQATSRTASALRLEGVVTFHYPDGSQQRERRSFTLDTRTVPPRVIASAFGAVLSPRGPAR